MAVTIENGDSLPAENIEVQVKVNDTIIDTYTIAQLNGENEVHQTIVPWDTEGFEGTGDISVLVNETHVIREYDFTNNTAVQSVVIPMVPQVSGLPALTNQKSFDITGIANPDFLVYLYNHGQIIDFGFADASGVFNLNCFTLSEGENILRFMAQGKEGWTSLFSPAYTVRVDSSMPEIRVTNITEGGFYNYDLIPAIEIIEDDPVEIIYTLDQQDWTPGTPVTAEGGHILYISVRDGAGNIAELTVPFTIDKTPPEIRIDGVEEGGCYNTDITPVVEVIEVNPDYVEQYLNGLDYYGETITAEGTYDLHIIAADLAGNISEKHIKFRIEKTAPPLEIRIISGTTIDYTDTKGRLWSADTGFTGGETVDRGSIEIENTEDDRIYQTERYMVENYAFNVPNGFYTVKLHFAETYTGITGPGQRVFDVNVEGAGINNLDVYQETGGRNRALVKTVTVTVTDGQLNIAFTLHVQNTMINGIEIIKNS